MRGFLGESVLPFVILCALVRAWKPALFIHECTRLFKWDVFDKEDLLGDYTIHSTIVDPTEYGFPIKRGRAYSAIVRDDLCLHYNLNYLFRLHISSSLDAGVFLGAPANEAGTMVLFDLIWFDGLIFKFNVCDGSGVPVLSRVYFNSIPCMFNFSSRFFLAGIWLEAAYGFHRALDSNDGIASSRPTTPHTRWGKEVVLGRLVGSVASCSADESQDGFGPTTIEGFALSVLRSCYQLGPRCHLPGRVD